MWYNDNRATSIVVTLYLWRVSNGKENRIFRETRYYGFATEDYNEFDLLNIDSNNYAVFIREK